MNIKPEIKIVTKFFIKENLKGIFLYILFCCIFIILFYLKSIPIDIVLYAVEVCAFFGFLYLAYEYYRIYKKHFDLIEIKKRISISMDDIPEIDRLVEFDYRQMLEDLYKQMKVMESDFFIRNKEMTDYYTLWAHQIKTPITAMSLILQSETGSNESQLKQELFKIEQYVEMVIQYLRMESMNSDLILAEYNLEKIVKQVIKKYATVFIYNKITLELDDLDVIVLTDEKWLNFVIGQLLSNSLKYTNEGFIKIYIKKDTVKTLVIEDNGIGISGEDLPRVFEQGFTGYNGRMDKKASGLGLYLCKKVMNNLSHKIRIESQERKGTKVFLDLNEEKLQVE